MGTAAYMSPEQAKGKKVDQRTDIFAFGAVLFEMLTERKAFVGEDVSEVLAAVIKSEPDWSALGGDVPPAWREMLRRCLEKNPSRRLRAIADTSIFLENGASFAAEVAPAESQWSLAACDWCRRCGRGCRCLGLEFAGPKRHDSTIGTALVGDTPSRLVSSGTGESRHRS